MGTRCTTQIRAGDENSQILVNLYRQYDGYIDGHGADLRDNFGDVAIINGIPHGADNSRKANGMGCLAAQVIAHFKEEIGGFYLNAPDDREYWNYNIFLHQGELWVDVRHGSEMEYHGPLAELSW